MNFSAPRADRPVSKKTRRCQIFLNYPEITLVRANKPSRYNPVITGVTALIAESARNRQGMRWNATDIVVYQE